MTRLRSAVFLIPLVASIVGVASGCRPTIVETSDQVFRLGTALRISVRSTGDAHAAIDRAFSRVVEIEQKMSVSEDDYETTELLEVNRAAGREPVAVSPDTYAVLEAALRYSELTGGAFDVTIWPLVRLWGIGSDDPRVPTAERLAAARNLVDYRRLELRPGETVYLPADGMGVDVGGIAKGYAADEAARILRDAGVEHALLDFGGNIMVIGDKPDGTPWRIGVQDPFDDRNQYIGIVEIVDRTVVTSGPYERYFVEDGVRYHHILDPETGQPADTGLAQVTIIAQHSIDADALSTSAYVLGLERGLALVESIDDVEALFVTEDRVIHPSSRGADSFRLTAEEDYTLAGG